MRARAAVQYSSRWSRLERMIRRLKGQQACLDRIAARLAEVPGPVLEIGLGKGRTYDHLRRLLPEREIYVFDREIHAFKDCIPPDDRLYLGEFHATIPKALTRFRGEVALANADFGRSDAEADAALAAWLGPQLAAFVRPGGYVLSDQPLAHQRLRALALPDGAEEGRIHLYQAQ